jgi:23S rRNA (guanosine2251-2'-O)-methyltransferase
MERPKSGPRDFRRPKPDKRHQKTFTRSPSQQLLPQDRVIFGLHAVEAALANPNRAIEQAYLTDNAAAKLAALLAARKIAVSDARPQDLDSLLGGGAVHQGALLVVEPLPQRNLEEFIAAIPDDRPAVLSLLDQVTDPHNVGAVLRSAAAFGIDALIVQDRHSPRLSGTLAKAASGALEYVPVIATVNLARALDLLKKHGFLCVGFDSEAEQKYDRRAITSSRVVFLFGAEDRGLRRLVREGCDVLYALSAPGPVKSLNISNAAAIVFYEASKARSQNAPR